MYIDKYWQNYIGGTDDSLNLVSFLEDQHKEEITLSEIFSKIGLDRQNWNFHKTVEYLEFTHSNGVEIDFHFAIDVITDLAAILLECYVNGFVNLNDLDNYNTPSRHIRIVATSEEHDALNNALKEFANDPFSYDLHELVDDKDMLEMAKDVEEIRKELYESRGSNRNFNVKKDDMKDLLDDWDEASGCFASNRIMIEGCEVGYCYREEPDGDWDSGWRFTAGDESDDYMNDPNNVGIYSLNSVCNNDNEIVSLLSTPYPCAFERDENGVFYQIEDEKLEDYEEDLNMDILAQCQKWYEESKHCKIIETLEAISADDCTPEMDSELARAYNNLADPHKPTCNEMLKKAIALLEPHEEYFKDDHCWNFRMGYSYYYLDQEARALKYFEKALEARPNDEDTKEFICWCKERIDYPMFYECFKDRTKKAWKEFIKQEKELRKIMDEDKNNEHGKELIKKCEDILNIAFYSVSFELGYNGEKYELILTPEGDKIKLFELIYFVKHAPKEIENNWNILVGRQANTDIAIRVEGFDINGDDVLVWIDKNDQGVDLSIYCEKTQTLLKEEENRVWWLLTTLTDLILGEIIHMRYIDSLNILDSIQDKEWITLTNLPKKLEEMGFKLSNDPESLLELYTGYQMNPIQDKNADLRLDTIFGSSCCVALLNEYLCNEEDSMDMLHADGSVAGFFYYPLSSFAKDDSTQQIFDFRDSLEDYLLNNCGESLTLIGGATGSNYGYVDFIAWDLSHVLQTAKEFFIDTNIEWANFHVFRRNAGSLCLKYSQDENNDDQEDIHKMKTRDYIPYTPENAEAFYEQLEKWNDDDNYTRCIEILDSIPEELRNYRSSYALARALENYAIIGDHNEGTPRYKGDEALLRAIDVLESVHEEGHNKSEWNMRMAYAYQYLYGQEEKAIEYAKRWSKLDPQDEDAILVIRECEQEIKNRTHTSKKIKKVKRTLSDVPFENFDFTNFWDDSDYALKEYVSNSPSNELIESIEEQLGYKLPSSYIWLMQQHNGGIPVNTCFPTDEPTSWAEDHVAITGIMGIGNEKDCSLCGDLGSQFMIDEWGYPDIGVAICDCPSAGHDMIFLDYRECGPQGEPKVIHIDQENDYKITYLADNFEEFICNLMNDEAFDLEDFDEDDNDTKEDNETSKKGMFTGFVLLSKGRWDKTQFIYDMKEKWNIDVNEDEKEKSDEALVFEVDGMMGVLGFMPYPIPDKEAEINAENNYMWADAVNAAKEHCAHIMVAVVGQEEDVYKKGKLFTKIISACCRQPYASGVYTSGVVFEPSYYENFAEIMKENRLPIYNWIWIGLYQSEKGMNAYTYGMDIFGKDEMEVLEANAQPGDLYDFLLGLISYVLEYDVVLQDSETIGFSEDDKHTITRSKGISLDGMTLKISYDSLDTEDNFVDEDDLEEIESIDMDYGEYHVETILKKELSVEEINAYNHMAIYLRWCMEHDLMSDDFLKEYKELVEAVKKDPKSEDLRHFIWDTLDGYLNTSLFNKTGKMFANYYYGNFDHPYYPSDIDSYAIEKIGLDRNYSDEIQDEAYLFIPYDETFYQDMSKIIERRFINWQDQDFDPDTMEPSELAEAMMEYLDCECTYFPSMKDDDPIMSAYSYAKRDSTYEGYIPMLIKVDEILWECLIMNSDPDNDGADDYEFNSDNVANYRKQMLSLVLKNGKEVFEKYLSDRKSEAEDDEMDWEKEIIGTMKGGYDNCRFSSYWNSETNMTYPLILAKIPVKNPWEIFAYLPFGGWNECPDTLDLMAISKYWFEKYSAIPAAMTHDELEFLLPKPIDKDKAIEVATEQYGFCPDVVDQQEDDPTVGNLADVLWQSTVWYFWWD